MLLGKLIFYDKELSAFLKTHGRLLASGKVGGSLVYDVTKDDAKP
jgi:hypothetical protein